MKVMILAAGLGERMRPLTEHTPKALLEVGGTPLVAHHICRLAAAGYDELVINVSHLGDQIVEFCGNGSRWGVSIAYSKEESPLETAGGIIKALPMLGGSPFLVVNGDVWIDYPFAQLAAYALRTDESAHLVMVPNPPQHPAGDFQLSDDNWIETLAPNTVGFTYSGVGVYSQAFFDGTAPGKVPLRPLMDAAISFRRLGGEIYRGPWEDVGTPERLRDLDIRVREQG